MEKEKMLSKHFFFFFLVKKKKKKKNTYPYRYELMKHILIDFQ
jgi:hypothetical protein